MISGTNGLLGAADGAFVLSKKRRTDNNATLDVTGRSAGYETESYPRHGQAHLGFGKCGNGALEAHPGASGPDDGKNLQKQVCRAAGKKAEGPCQNRSCPML